MELSTETLRDGPRLLRVQGEMDLYNAEDYKQQIAALLNSDSAPIIIDLSNLSYIDSSGIGALLYTVTQSKARQIVVCFIGVTGSVRTVIELTSLLGFLPIKDSVDAALNFVTQ